MVKSIEAAERVMGGALSPTESTVSYGIVGSLTQIVVDVAEIGMIEKTKCLSAELEVKPFGKWKVPTKDKVRLYGNEITRKVAQEIALCVSRSQLEGVKIENAPTRILRAREIDRNSGHAIRPKYAVGRRQKRQLC